QAGAREAEQGGRDDDALQHECFSSSVRSTDTSPRPVQGEPSGEPSEVEPESELLAAFGTLGERKAEGRRLQAALVPQPVVHVEHVEHLPERRRRVLAAEPEDLADTKVGALVDGGAPRIARL